MSKRPVFDQLQELRLSANCIPQVTKIALRRFGQFGHAQTQISGNSGEKNTQRLFEPEYSTAPPDTDGAV